MESWGLSSFMYTSRDGCEAVIPYVGYVWSPKLNDSIFILPKVFLFEGSGNASEGETAFGKYLITDVMEISPEHNPLKKDGLDAVIFSLSTWLYRAIDKYSTRHPKSGIIRRSVNRSILSTGGTEDQTLLDTILSLLNYHKEHSELFTYISIINSSGHDRIHWNKTISKIHPVIRNGEPFYAEFRTRDKAMNYDEELIILYYSVLQYLRQLFFFQVKANLNYPLLKPVKIDALIESGRGTRLLRSIRRKYFKDELVSLWKLLYAFFDKSESARSGRCREEALLASTFDRVFEDMVDSLIGDDIFSSLKENEDGKEIDHIYKDRSMLGDGQIYYIGDSKYYFYGHDIDKESIYKQFTYAKNIIQLNINIFNKPDSRRNDTEKSIIRDVRYRDPLTEGYNLTPNFFIRGYVKAEDLTDGHACYSEDRLQPNNQLMPANSHFEGRPFDRDTLVLQAYNINFLFVLASYVNNSDNEGIKAHIHERFRTDLLRMFNSRFDFFKVTPTSGGIAGFIRKHFEEYIGRMYHADGGSFIWFAFDKTTMPLEKLRSRFSNTADVEPAVLS